MTQEDKQLLLQDLCARLPYKVRCYNTLIEEDFVLSDVTNCDTSYPRFKYGILGPCDIKPYLFPLSSITEEHRKEICDMLNRIHNDNPPYGIINPKGCDALLITTTMQVTALVNFYCRFHYDYNNLIERDLAVDATNLNIY